MANLRTTMDAAFGELNIACPKNLDGCAKAVPGEGIPLDGSKASRAIRVQQLSLLGNGFPLGIIPSWAPSSKEDGSLSLQSLLLQPSFGGWWIGLIGKFRPKKLISAISGFKLEAPSIDGMEVPSVKDFIKPIFDKSLYSIGLCSHIPLTSSTSIMLNSEMHGEREGRRNRLMLRQDLPNHDILLEAAWPQLFIDKGGRYWDVPESVSLDIASITSESGLQYRFGIQKNGGTPQGVNATNADIPAALLPGLCTKAAVSYEKSRHLWRQRETKDDFFIKTNRGLLPRPAYDVRLKEPHATVSAIIGATCGAWFGGEDKSSNQDADVLTHSAKKRNPVFADLFGSLCFTFQHGKFRKPFGDMTRVDARLDMLSASAFAKSISHIFNHSLNNSQDSGASPPSLGLIFQQQVAGPIVFRIDTQCAFNSSAKSGLQIEDYMYSLNYSLRLLRSGKVVAWYSPKRKEGMIELRVYEF